MTNKKKKTLTIRVKYFKINKKYTYNKKNLKVKIRIFNDGLDLFFFYQQLMVIYLMIKYIHDVNNNHYVYFFIIQ